MNYLADRMRLVKPSPSMAVSQAAKAMRAQGEDVIDLGLGDLGRNLRALIAPRVGHTIAFGMSDNRLKPVSNRYAAHLGFEPQDNTEVFRETIEANHDKPDPHANGAQYLGGWFCELGHPDDEAKK